MLLGGFLGFAVCFATGCVAGNDIGQTFFNAMLGCLAGAFLFKWIAGLLVDCIVQSRRAKMVAAAQKEAAAKGAAK